ncbi:hypothetical protein MTR67_001434 [Solanum verrucosum]|uniref:Tf2-1-like SH3-like domain-containing protein n=1 Tax=Solanum verrucosum TaxID=315347 RepID=A0AAF0T7V7_SOLVR|nr:hypothetical protein MTR67_001434 [Solanum verrucosum]
MKGVMKFGRRGKLSPRYIGPFEILRTVGEVAYELALPPAFSAIHPVFHVSMLSRYVPDESHVIQYDEVDLDDSLRYIEEPVVILARDVRRLRSRAIPVVKIHWRHRPVEEATWEIEHEMRAQFPGLFEHSAPARADADTSDDVITGTVLLCHQPASALFDPGSSYSNISVYCAPRLSMIPELLVEPFVFQPRVDLILLDMVDFDLILGMDWLSPHHAVLDCYAKTVTLAMPGIPPVVWQGSCSRTPVGVISFVRAQRCVSYRSAWSPS